MVTGVLWLVVLSLCSLPPSRGLLCCALGKLPAAAMAKEHLEDGEPTLVVQVNLTTSLNCVYRVAFPK